MRYNDEAFHPRNARRGPSKRARRGRALRRVEMRVSPRSTMTRSEQLPFTGVEFRADDRDMMLVDQPGSEYDGWLLYRHPDGQRSEERRVGKECRAGCDAY